MHLQLLRRFLIRHIDREAVVDAAFKHSSPSAGAQGGSLRSTEKKEMIDAIYDWRPLDLPPTPLAIYHPAFANFIRLINAADEHEDLVDVHLYFTQARRFIETSLRYYAKEEDRQTALLTCIPLFPGGTVLLEGRHFRPDGHKMIDIDEYHKAITQINELKEGLGQGDCDPIEQAECGYRITCSSPNVRACTPSLTLKPY